jgi:hypothetical protein
MWRETPDQRLWMARERQTQLIREAAEYRLANSRPREHADNLATRMLASLRIRLANLMSLVRRTLADHEAPCNDPCPDVAF